MRNPRHSETARRSRPLSLYVVLLASSCLLTAPLGAVDFVRGDVDADGRVNFADVALLWLWSHRDGIRLPCEDAADVHDNGRILVEVAGVPDDLVRLQNWLMAQSVQPSTEPNLPAPFPLPGADPTNDAFGCSGSDVQPIPPVPGTRFRWNAPRRLEPLSPLVGPEAVDLLLEVDTTRSALGLSLVYEIDTSVLRIRSVDLQGTSVPVAFRRILERSSAFRWELLPVGRTRIALLHVHALFMTVDGKPVDFPLTRGSVSRLPVLRIRADVISEQRDGPVRVMRAFRGPYFGGISASVGGSENGLFSLGSDGESLPLLPPQNLDDYVPIVSGPEKIIFRRGDANSDARIDIADATFTLRFLFGGGDFPEYDDAADTNDDGAINIADAIFTLGALFLGTETIPAPFPNCGGDMTTDSLDCCSYSACLD